MTKPANPHEFVKQQPEWAKPIYAWAEHVIRGVYPDVEARLAWMGIGYKYGKNYTCQVYTQKDHVQIMLMRGVMLSDPTGVLQGVGSNTRHIKFYPDKTRNDSVFQALLRQQKQLFDGGVKWEG